MRNHIVSAFLLGLILVCLMMGCTDIGPVDEHGRNYRPWNENPYAKQEHWMDRKVWMDVEEEDRQQIWLDENPARNIGDYMFRK